MTGAERRAVALLAGVFSVRMLGLFLLLPVVALYADRFPDATPLLVGMAVGVYGFTQALLQIPFGLMSDRLGRKPVIIFGLLVFAAGSLVAASSESALGLVAGRALQGAGAVSAAITALIADLTRVEVRTRAMAIIGISIGASFMLALAAGPAIAGLLGTAGLFNVTAGLALIAVIVVAQAVPTPQAVAGPMTTAGALREALGSRRLLQLDFGVFVLHMLLTASFVAVPFSLLGASDQGLGRHGLFYLQALLISVIPTVALIVVSERSSRSQGIFGLAIVLIGGAEFMLWALAGDARWLLPALALFFTGFNFLEARLPARISELAEPGARGAALGVYASCQFLGAFAGGLAGGWALGAGGPEGVYAVCAVLAAIWWATAMIPARRPVRAL